MKELAYSLAQLLVIVVIMITLAVSWAAVGQWAEGGGRVGAASGQQEAVAFAAR